MVEMMFIILGVTLLILGLMVVSGDPKPTIVEVIEIDPDDRTKGSVYINLHNGELGLRILYNWEGCKDTGPFEYLGEL